MIFFLTSYWLYGISVSISKKELLQGGAYGLGWGCEKV